MAGPDCTTYVCPLREPPAAATCRNARGNLSTGGEVYEWIQCRSSACHRGGQSVSEVGWCGLVAVHSYIPYVCVRLQ